MGKYVVLEGLDFSGKSTLAKKLAEKLEWPTVNEPYTGNEHAAEVKRMNNANYLPKHYEMMMIIAGRIDCFDEVIDKHREKGIISDRCVVSSMVYQSTERISMYQVLSLNIKSLMAATHDVLPDHIVFLDITHETFLERIHDCNRPIDAKDRWLMEKANWLELRTKYSQALDIMVRYGVKVHVITPETTVEEVIEKIK